MWLFKKPKETKNTDLKSLLDRLLLAREQLRIWHDWQEEKNSVEAMLSDNFGPRTITYNGYVFEINKARKSKYRSKTIGSVDITKIDQAIPNQIKINDDHFSIAK